MKTITTRQWKRSNAIHFLFHFVCNYKESIENPGVFEFVASMRSRSQWLTMIREMFPEKNIARMKAARNFEDRLDFEDSRAEILRTIWQAPYARPRLRRMLMKVLMEELDAHMGEMFERIPYSNRLYELQRILRLNNFERDALFVLSLAAEGILVVPRSRTLSGRCESNCAFIASCLDYPVDMVREAMDENNRLRRYACVDRDYDFNKQLFQFLEGYSNEPFTNEYFTLWRGEALPWDYFEDLAKEHGAMLKRMITGRLAKPVNILIYGGAGVGKTSFVQSLARELKRECYFIRQNVSGSSWQVDSARDSRFGALLYCARRVHPEDCIIVVDEADRMVRGNETSGDVLNGNNMPFGDKCLLNNVLETYKAPTVWITNSPPEALDPTCRRRFDYCVRIEPLSDTGRRTVWRNTVSRLGMEQLIGEDMQKDLAVKYPLSAGGVSLVLQNLAGLSPQPEEVGELLEKLMASHCRMTGIPQTRCGMLPAKDYSLDGLNIKSEFPLSKIVKAIRNFLTDKGDPEDRPRMNLLLSGPPGTGKTEYVKYLSRELKIGVIVKTGSDLLNMYVGGTEQRIRSAFEEAEAQKAILFLDEIDGMGQSRTRAVRNWEVTQVEELLQRMDMFKGVMIGATNFGVCLDDAFLRRFTYKLEFDYLDETGKKLFFERMFRTSLTPEEARELARIPMLAPGDFRTVRQSLYYLADEVDNHDRIAALARESEIKLKNKYAPKRKIGF